MSRGRVLCRSGSRTWLSLNALRRKGVRLFRNDDPGNDVCQRTDSCENDEERGEDANEIQIPSIMKRKACADSRDHAVGTRARELAGGWEGVGKRCGCGIDGGSAGRAETGGRFQLISTTSTEHGSSPETFYFDISAKRQFRAMLQDLLRNRGQVTSDGTEGSTGPERFPSPLNCATKVMIEEIRESR